MTDYYDYYDAAKKDGEAVIQGEHGGCYVRHGERRTDACEVCRGQGIDGEPGDEPGTGYTWPCEACGGTGKVVAS